MVKGLIRSVIFLVVTLIVVSGCETTPSYEKNGIQEPYVAFVPARIAVLPCREWPNPARFKSLPLNIAKEEQIKEVCQEFDKFVVDGFKEQPFMRGYSPKAIEKLLKQADAEDYLKQLDSRWQKQPADCVKCKTEGAYYVRSIVDRPDWRLWLSELSKKTRNVDAVLIPFFMYAAEAIHDDRGLYRYERAVRLSLLLIDTSNGGLIWYNFRVGRASNQKLIARSEKESLSPPEWSEAVNRAIVEDFWDEFPGRQYY